MLELRQHKERVENIQRQIIMQPTYSQLNTLCGGARLILLDANEFIPNRDFKNLDAYRGYGDHVNSYVRWYCNRNRKVEGDEWDKLYWQTYLNGARARIFNDYLLFLEHKREPRKMFYKPKIKQFEKFQLIESYQGMLDDKYDILCISMPPGTGKTTLLKFFHSAVIGWFPDDYSLFYSHSGDITRMYYDGVYQMVDDSLEYAWHDIFPDLKITSTNALMQQFNVGKYKPFPSLQTTSVGAKSAGKVRASKFLLTDDMIGSLEEALNKNYLDKMWGAYTVDALQRKTVDSNNNPCKEIMQATRWSTQDVIGRLIDIYDGNNRVRVISIPATDPETGDSNFDYAIGGFTKEFFANQALLMDDVSYNCLYKQQPVEREGLLFPEEKIMRYKELPTSKIERITAQADTKSTGTDFFVLPVLIKYEGKDLYYCVDCVCSSSPDYEAQYENSANLLVDNKVEDCEFESNNGGDRVSLEVNKRVLKKGWICNISFRATETNKEARIYQCSNWILQHVVFKDKKLYTPKEPYGVMMSLLAQYSTSGKKQLDDVPDTFANFALRIQRREPKPARIINSIY
nr:MAG TPA: Terminase [Bacteriophage sp.]